MTETWKSVEDYEGYYEISDHARVRSVDRIVFKSGRPGVPYRFKGKILALAAHPAGYLQVGLWRDNRMKLVTVHRLVAIAFVEGRADGLIVCHKDGNPQNNVPTNLYWGTFSDNMQDMQRHGRNWEMRKTHCPKGHPYDETNTIHRSNGKGRWCLLCSRERKRAYYYRVTKPANAAILAERRARGEQVGRWPKPPE